MILTDVNVLIYAHREDAADHRRFRDWMEKVIAGPEAFGIADLVLSGFLRVATHPRIFHPPTPFAVAAEFCDFLRSQPNTLARVNGQPVSTTLLRNGDTIELGAAVIQCWLSPVRQRSLGLREAVSWFLVAAVIVAQIAVLYWLVE